MGITLPELRRPHAPFSRYRLVNSLGHLRIKREKRNTCPIRSFLPPPHHFGGGFYQPPTRTEKRARDSRSTTAPAAALDWPATQMSPSRSQTKACGSRPRATVATFANLLPASPVFLEFPLRSRDFAMAVYSRGRRPSADLSDWLYEI